MRLEPLDALDRAQTTAAAVIARIGTDDWQRPTPCDEWSVRDIVNKAGGRVGIATKPGEYTRFRVRLPHEKKATDAAVA